jgi:hypothetical protein
MIIDKSNQIAKKHLQKLEQDQAITVTTSTVEFIEEPGRTKVVELHRLSGRDVLEKLHIGDCCQLKLKGRYISVETATGCYVGSLPEDVSFTLSKLIRTGNTYTCCVRSVTPTACSVFLAEKTRAAENQHTPSFPTSRPTALIDDYLVENDDASGLLEDLAAPDTTSYEDGDHGVEITRGDDAGDDHPHELEDAEKESKDDL